MGRGSQGSGRLPPGGLCCGGGYVRTLVRDGDEFPSADHGQALAEAGPAITPVPAKVTVRRMPPSTPWTATEEGPPEALRRWLVRRQRLLLRRRFHPARSAIPHPSISSARRSRGERRRGIRYLQDILPRVSPDDPTAPRQIAGLHRSIGGLYMYEGDFANASREFAAARDAEGTMGAELAASYEALLGMAALAAGRDRELRRLLQRGELHLPARRRGQSTAGRPAHARRSGTSPPTSKKRPGGPRRPLAAERRLHDARRVPRQGPAEAT